MAHGANTTSHFYSLSPFEMSVSVPARSVPAIAPVADTPCEVTLHNPVLLSDYTITTPQPAVDANHSTSPGQDIDLSGFTMQLPDDVQSIVDRVKPVALINHIMPYGWVQEGARFVAACLWVWLCLINEMSTTPGNTMDWARCMFTLAALHQSPYAELLPEYSSQPVVMAFCNIVRASRLDTPGWTSRIIIEPWKGPFWAQLLRIVDSLVQDIVAKKHERPLQGYNELNLLAMASRPFMVLVRASFHHEADLHHPGTPSDRLWRGIMKLEANVAHLMHVQSDLLGWLNDLVNQCGENLIEMRLKDGQNPSESFAWVLYHHDRLVREICQEKSACHGDLLEWIRRHVRVTTQHQRQYDNLTKNLKIVVGFGTAMAFWVLEVRLLDQDMSVYSVPESFTRAKYRALERQESFEELMKLE